MADRFVYSAKTVSEGLRKTLHQYLEVQYHIWDADLIAERQRLLETPGVTFQEPRLEATPSYFNGLPYSSLKIPTAAQKLLTLASAQLGTGIFPEPYAHQSSALEAVLGRDDQVIVATGTGSGKTESFLLPILGALAIESASRPEGWLQPGVRALLLYPMNALVNDQLSRLRRLLGNQAIATALQGSRPSRVTFGMYTSRTPYPGLASASRDRDRIGALIAQLYQGISPESRARLEQEGKWPAKDLDLFAAAGFATGASDSELFSRQEMQQSAPDLLITNYSMLEYMLLRPIERSIFDQTATWLATSSENRLIVVLDEAHMYRGSGGAEVAYLLRRLHSRLRVSRDRVKYILTSASLGSTSEAREAMGHFAAQLTGLGTSARPFVLIAGEPARKPGERVATDSEIEALAHYDFNTLHRVFEDVPAANAAIQALANRLSFKVPAAVPDEAALRQSVWDWLSDFGPAARAANLITSRPLSLAAIAGELFGRHAEAGKALESLVALMAFGRDQITGRVFAPVRSHLFFRGLPGLFVCVNPKCRFRLAEGPSALGRMFAAPRLRCDCGSRVYELLTHRDCGAAFIRGFLADESGTFLWHERSSGLWSELKLLEAHFLVEVTRRSQQVSGRLEGTTTWLHIATGQLRPTEPKAEERDDYIAVLRPDGLVDTGRRFSLSFDKECPVCVRTWQGTSKIMDLMTKGEAPFAHLVREQVALQPLARTPTEQAPNGGRKALLFSDGRQKAARLARDIPREVEQDVFRQLLLLGAAELNRRDTEAVLNHSIYVAALHVLSKTGLQLFDGADREILLQHVKEYRRWHGDDLLEALRHFVKHPPPTFTALLLRQLGSRFYSVSALTLAHLRPTAAALRVLQNSHPDIALDRLLPLVTSWIQGFADAFAFDSSVKPGVRQQAAGYPTRPGLDALGGFTKRQQSFLRGEGLDLDALASSFADTLCEGDPNKGRFLAPNRVRLENSVESTWYQCRACTAVLPVHWWSFCPNCLTAEILPVAAAGTSYLRARKGFWRDPVLRVLSGLETPLNLTVEEHTAQLSYRDLDQPDPTTEQFERRFRDIFIKPNETAVDVLSSTTTMEVGIDIGSLVAVALRNVPPLRQNYQQRAGRSGRRGSAISTVVTYAQNSPHDNHYFENPERIISGEPTLPSVDTQNSKIIERHIRAQLIQAFSLAAGVGKGNANLFTLLGETWDFYTNSESFALVQFEAWLASAAVRDSYESILAWLPDTYDRHPSKVAEEFIADLKAKRPVSEDEMDPADRFFIEFLFSHGFLPAYAFPRDLCALQIEEERAGAGRRVHVVERPQQGLAVALSEYAPGRLVVVNKRTYRVGTVAANGSSFVVDRAARLFAERKVYVHCASCLFTKGIVVGEVTAERCPLCRTGDLKSVNVIQPEVVYPEGGSEIDEFNDEQVFSQATSAQLPLPAGQGAFGWRQFRARGRLAISRNQSLVMVNRGEDTGGATDGFLVCNRCGKTAISDAPVGPHQRDYLIEARKGVRRPDRCTGSMERVYLGYDFASDVLLFRMPILAPLRFDPSERRNRQPIADALQSLSEGLVLAVSQELAIDSREMSAGFRFVRDGDDYFADVFLYDTLAGGAGYAIEAGLTFTAVVGRLETLLRHCDCSSSCDKCLRHYGNRFHHEALDRFLALDLLKFVTDGTVPEVFTVDEQRTNLESLAALLRLAGWSVVEPANAPFTASRPGLSVDLWCCPSLVDPKAIGLPTSGNSRSFSPYELAKDLPGAYAEIA